MNFVEHVVYNCQTKTIEEFHLDTYNSFVDDSDLVRVGELLKFIIERNVRIFTLKFYLDVDRHIVKLPSTILTCLVKLTLGCWDPDLDIPEFGIYSPNLKFLSIHFQYLDPKFPHKLFRSCPLLEELY